MIRYELFWITLVSIIYCATCQGATSHTDSNINNKDKPPDKLILHKSQPYTESEDQQSFMSKIVTWILPFGERRDSIGGPQYISPPQSQSHIQKDCSPCNRIPWVPITSSVGEKTIINFSPPIRNFGHPPSSFSDSSILETLHPPPVSYSAPVRQYGPPVQFRPKDQNYLAKYPQQPSFQQYAPFPNKGEAVVVDYMLPPPVNYRIPSLMYGPPSRPSSFPPIKPAYGPPEPVYQPVPPTGYNNQYQQQSPQTFISPPALFNSLPQNHGTTYLRPVAQNYQPPSSSIYDFPDHQQTGFDDSATEKNIQVFPSDSYGAPVTGDTLNYFSPHEQLSSANEQREYLEKPIPLPNLSSYPVLPFRNYGDFNQNRVGIQYNDNTEVKIQESVKIADYLATIEHPIDVIQSPLIELSIKDDSYDEGDRPYESNRGPENLNTIDSNGHPYKSQTLDEQNYNREEKAHKPIEAIKEELKNYDTTSTKLSENPIVVEDIHVAASNNNNTFANSDEVHIKRSNSKDLATPNQLEHLNGANIIKDLLLNHKTTAETLNSGRNDDYLRVKQNFTTPPLDYSSWRPTYGVTMSSFKVSLDLGGSPTAPPKNHPNSTKKPKILQIIVPYVTNKKSRPFEKDWVNKNQNRVPQTVDHHTAYTTLVPVFTPPSTAGVSDWARFMALGTEPVTATVLPKVTTAVYNIRDLLNNQTEHDYTEQLPYDIISLQKHIDDWTQQAYSKNTENDKQKLSSPKEIPSDYFTTQEPSSYTEATTSGSYKQYYELEESKKKKAQSKTEYTDIDTNLIQLAETTTEKRIVTTTKPEYRKPSRNVSHVTVLPQTKEKVYVVTPQVYNFPTSTPATAWSSPPKVENGKINNGSTYDSYKFSIRVEAQNKTTEENGEREGKEAMEIVYSEWPHLINNLQTTTKKPTWRHPLFGLMDIPSYTPSPNSTVETIFGHSRVALAVTSPSVSFTSAEKTTKTTPFADVF